MYASRNLLTDCLFLQRPIELARRLTNCREKTLAEINVVPGNSGSSRGQLTLRVVKLPSGRVSVVQSLPMPTSPDHAGNDVEELLIQIDTRYPYVDFLALVVNFANQSRCLFCLEHEGDFVDAASTAIFEALNRSPAAALAKRRFDRPKNR